MVDFQQGLTKAGLLDEALAALRWGASYLMACHPQPNVFMAVQGNHSLDFHYYVGIALRHGRTSMHVVGTAHVTAPCFLQGPPEHYEEWVSGPGASLHRILRILNYFAFGQFPV